MINIEQVASVSAKTVLAAVVALAVSTPASADLVSGGTRDVTTATGLDYVLINNATLNVTGSGAVHFVKATQSVVNIQSGGQAQAVNASLSTVSLSNATINTGQLTLDAISLYTTTAELDTSRVTANNGMGLVAQGYTGAGMGSTVNIANSEITGTTAGVQVASQSTVTASGSQFTGTDGSALWMLGAGTASLADSALAGSTSGILVTANVDGPATGTVNLDHTQVVGQGGSAIEVNEGGIGVINVNNGSTLTGSNGNLLSTTGDSTATMSVTNSALAGNIVNEAGSQISVVLQDNASITGQMTDVTNLAVNNNAQWIMTGDSSVGAMSLDGGTVSFGVSPTFYTLSLDSLKGNGTFVMAGDFARGVSDFLNVSGEATGAYNLRFSSSGADPVSDSSLHVVHTGGGGAEFALEGGPVDLGTYSYGLVQQGNDWYLDASTRTVSPGAQSVIALFNTAPTIWYGELSSLRSRMGELRLNGGQAGAWMRTYGNRYDIDDAAGIGYQQTQQGVSLGADAPLPLGDGHWLVGVLAGYSRSDLNLARGTSGSVDSYYGGLYTTWLEPQSGYYFDGVVKINHFGNNSTVALSDGTQTKGNYDNVGVGGSVEFGRHVKLPNDYFVEPFGQLSTVVIQGRDYELGNGMQGDGDKARSVLGKLGVTGGRNFDLGQGRYVQPYVKVAAAHEFINNNRVQVNSNVFNNDLSGTRGELGAGIAVSMSERLQLHADFDYSNGDKLEQPWGANVGMRYSW